MVDPFEKDETLYGRGSAYMKTGVTAMMYTVAELRMKCHST